MIGIPGDSTNFPADVRAIEDGDKRNATNLAAATEDLADRTAYLAALVDPPAAVNSIADLQALTGIKDGSVRIVYGMGPYRYDRAFSLGTDYAPWLFRNLGSGVGAWVAMTGGLDLLIQNPTTAPAIKPALVQQALLTFGARTIAGFSASFTAGAGYGAIAAATASIVCDAGDTLALNVTGIMGSEGAGSGTPTLILRLTIVDGIATTYHYATIQGLNVSVGCPMPIHCQYVVATGPVTVSLSGRAEVASGVIFTERDYSGADGATTQWLTFQRMRQPS